jgi:TolB protein
MERLLCSGLVLSLLVALAPACGSAGGTSTDDGASGASATAGASAKGGSSSTGAGGTSATGGTSSAGPGGTSSTGGTSATGGTSSTGGTSAAGGTSSTGGTSATGGTSSTGGTSATGGTSSTGGSGTAGTGTAGTSSTGGSSGGPKTLAILPADATLSPPANVSPTLSYKAYLQTPTAPDVDVTAQTTFTINPPTFGSFAGAAFTAPAGTLGKATVSASAMGLNAATSVTITMPQVVIGGGADAGSPGKFGGGDDPNAKPSLVYPSSGIVLPPNMNTLEIHFIPAAGQTLFSLVMTSPTVSLTAYFGCTKVGAGCVYAPDKTFWTVLANSARGGAPVSYVLKGVNGASPGKVGTSAAQTMQFSTEDVVGGLYYWNSGGTIQRYDFGFPSKAETYLDPLQAGAFTCVGCHAISRDGTRIVAGLDIPAPANYRVFDVATKKVLFSSAVGANFFSFSPEASKMLYSDGVRIGILDAATGNVINNQIIPVGTMPDWSADGKMVAFAKPKTPPFLAVPGVDSAGIDVITFDGTSWSAPKELVAFNGQNNYYPAISPDGSTIAFDRSPSNRNSFDNGSVDTMTMAKPDGQIWAVPSGGGAAQQLAAASQGKGDQWPKWAPTVYSYQGGKVMYLTVSSWRQYGLRLAEGDRAQLWMIAFDPTKAASGDGSFPAFWMPFQDSGTGNHIAQWVQKIARKPCNLTGECAAGEVCSADGRCIPEKP